MNLRQAYHRLSELSKQWQGVTRHFRTKVVHFSTGVAWARSSHVRRIAACTPGQVNSQRRRLQRFVSGQERWELTHFFGEWTRSLIQHLGCREVTLVVDETKLQDHFGVMLVGLAYRRRCLPLAWAIYPANDAAAYPACGQVALILGLLRAVQAGIPPTCRVCVLADRGIGTSSALLEGIGALGWTFLVRVTKASTLVLPDGTSVVFAQQVQAPGEQYVAQGQLFKSRGRIPVTVQVWWEPGHQEPWALVTNAAHLDGWTYARRMWIEEAFRDLKSHGWDVDHAQLRCPQRLARLWVVLVVAYTWLFWLGEALAHTNTAGPRRRLPDGTEVHQWSFFRIGWLAFIRAHAFYPR